MVRILDCGRDGMQMNDFTKEELKALRASVSATEINNSGLYGDKFRYEESKKLYNKIQSLIDNYECDHFGIIKLDDNFQPISNEECMFCNKPME